MKKALVVLMVASLAFGLAACGGKEKETEVDNSTDTPVTDDSTDDGEPEDTTEPDDTMEEDDSLEFDNLTVDTDNGEISFEAVINGTYFTEPTRHAIVWEEGGNAEKAMFRSNAYNVDFHDALEALGLSGDSNVSMDDMSASVEDNVVNTGDAIEYFIKWDGQEEIALSEVIKADQDFDWNLVFAGNRSVAVDTQAGCILCLDSCAAGVAVNALPVGTTGEGGTQFYANEEVLPEDGTTVTIIVRPAK